MDSSPVSLAAYVQLVRENREFRLLWFAQIVSEIGDWLYTVAIYSRLLEYTGSAKAVALAFVMQVLPQFFIAPAAGVINDRLSRRKVMIFADWTRAIVVTCMLFVRGPEMVPFLYGLLFLETVMWAFFEPGRNAIIPNITSGSWVLVANALSSTTWSFNFAIGSAVGGAFTALFGRDAVFLINGLSFVASALFLRRMNATEPHVENAGPLRVRDLINFSPIVEGLRYVRKDKRLFATLFVKCGLGLMGTNWVIITVLGERVFPIHIGGLDAQRAGVVGMSILMASRGLGALIGPLIGSRWAGRRLDRLRVGILFGFASAAVGYLLLGRVNSMAAAFLCLMIGHAGGSVIWVFSTTLLQVQTDDRFRGRVFSAEFAFNMLTMSTVSYWAGVMVDEGYAVQSMATATGLMLMVPFFAWAGVLRAFWPRQET